MQENVVLLFDGECNLCNRTVQFVITRDKKGSIKFASLQSETGKKLLVSNKIEPEYMSSFVFIERGQVFFKSKGIFQLMKYLNGAWVILYVLKYLPKFLTDFFYDFIAKRRVKWFGKADTCWVMTPELKDRFL